MKISDVIFKITVIFVLSLHLFSTRLLISEQESEILQLKVLSQIIENKFNEIELKTCKPNFKLMQKATVDIMNLDLKASGGGVCINYKGIKYILTAYHVIEKSEDIYVIGGFNMTRCKVIKKDKKHDLALLSTPEVTLNDVRYVDISEHEGQAGEEIWTCGNPMGIQDSITNGFIIRNPCQYSFFSYNAPTWFGSSGGGIFNRKTELIGIMSRVAFDVNVITNYTYTSGLAVNLATIRKFLDE